jgi:hypothetical protein
MASSSISSTSSGSSSHGNIIVVVVIVVISAAYLAAGAAGWGVVVVFSSSSTGSVAIVGRRRKVSCDVLDAFVTRTVDQISRWRALAALDVGCFLDELGITAFAGSGAGLAVAAAVVVCAVVGHSVVGGRGSVKKKRGRFDRQHSVKMTGVAGVTSLTRVAGSGLGLMVWWGVKRLDRAFDLRCVYCEAEEKNKVGIAAILERSKFTGFMFMRDEEGRSV